MAGITVSILIVIILVVIVFVVFLVKKKKRDNRGGRNTLASVYCEYSRLFFKTLAKQSRSSSQVITSLEMPRPTTCLRLSRTTRRISWAFETCFKTVRKS